MKAITQIYDLRDGLQFLGRAERKKLVSGSGKRGSRLDLQVSRRRRPTSVAWTLPGFSGRKVVCSPMQLKHKRADQGHGNPSFWMDLGLMHLSSEEKLVNHNSMRVMLPSEKPYFSLAWAWRSGQSPMNH